MFFASKGEVRQSQRFFVGQKVIGQRGLISNEVSTNSKNRHGEFTRIQIMTFIDEKCWLPARAVAHYSLLKATSITIGIAIATA